MRLDKFAIQYGYPIIDVGYFWRENAIQYYNLLDRGNGWYIFWSWSDTLD